MFGVNILPRKNLTPSRVVSTLGVVTPDRLFCICPRRVDRQLSRVTDNTHTHTRMTVSSVRLRAYESGQSSKAPVATLLCLIEDVSSFERAISIAMCGGEIGGRGDTEDKRRPITVPCVRGVSRFGVACRLPKRYVFKAVRRRR